MSSGFFKNMEYEARLLETENGISRIPKLSLTFLNKLVRSLKSVIPGTTKKYMHYKNFKIFNFLIALAYIQVLKQASLTHVNKLT